MAKALGLIGNFKGKLGNTVGYSLKDSNNKQTQGVRVYQPVVRNPKTAAQAEQRCKLAPINATYRALKMVIDRGQEGKAYGNKSRLAWLKDALKVFEGGYFVKGSTIEEPALLQLTKGSLSVDFNLQENADSLTISLPSLNPETTTTLGQLSALILAKYTTLKSGDQITFVGVAGGESGIGAMIDSIVLDSNSTDAIPSFILLEQGDFIAFDGVGYDHAFAVIVSREGDNGAHLRSTSYLIKGSSYDDSCLAAAAKQAAIESYMSQGANTDWAEESLM